MPSFRNNYTSADFYSRPKFFFKPLCIKDFPSPQFNHVSRYIAKLENSNPNIPTIGKSQMFAPKFSKFFVVLQQLFSFNASVSPTIISCFLGYFAIFYQTLYSSRCTSL